MEYRSLLSITDLSDAEVDALLDSAADFLPRIEQGGCKDAALRGTSTILLFYEPSTRTRVSFELAGKLLSSDTINISAKGSSVEKGETLKDTAQTLAAMHHDVVVLRHPAADAAEVFATHFPHAVLNAGSGQGQHPSQALLDAFVLRQHGCLAAGKTLVVVGDIAHSRVLRSGLQLLIRRGVHVTLVAPPTLMPAEWQALAGAGGPGRVSWTTELDAALPGADALMMLRMQQERMERGLLTSLDEYSKLYGLNRRRLKLLRPEAVIMHPGPVNRGVEVGADVFADERCRINDQVTAGLAVRCALLCWACGRQEPGLMEGSAE